MKFYENIQYRSFYYYCEDTTITKEIINDLRGLELPGMQKCENFELDFSLGAHL